MIWIIMITVFATVFLVTYGLAVLWSRRHRVQVRVANPGPLAESPLLSRKPTSPLKEWLTRWLTYSGQWALPTDMDKASEMRKDLIKAGYRHPRAPAIYLGLRIIYAIAFSLPFLLYCVIKAKLTLINFGVAFVLAIFGFFLVSKILSVMIRHRQNRLDRSLPDIIDLFVISMEAGLSLNAAMQRVGSEIRGVYRDFADELQIATGELRAGIPWEETFDNLAKRTDVQSIRSMVGLMIQSNKLGASIADALRNHADFIRTQRILIAEEKAAKLPVKMIFPLIICIMPAILIVVAGPGLIHILEIFMKAGVGGMFTAPK